MCTASPMRNSLRFAEPHQPVLYPQAYEQGIGQLIEETKKVNRWVVGLVVVRFVGLLGYWVLELGGLVVSRRPGLEI